MKPKCGRVGCLNAATHTPVISFASVQDPKGPRVTMQFPIHVCSKHADTHPDAYISDQGWSQILTAFMIRGLATPDRKSIQVQFKPAPEDVPE